MASKLASPAIAPNSSDATARLRISRRAGPQRALSGKVGAGFDPCARAADFYRAEAGSTSARSFSSWARPQTRMGCAHLLNRYRGAKLSARARGRQAALGRTLGAVQVETPDPAWTCWSTAGCCTKRLPAASGRATAFYQVGGAYGFRDQLQDVMASVHRAPGRRARAAPACRRASVSRG